jgi:lactate dehydrogenase-like 2-hydroxyacid dehydrogenase
MLKVVITANNVSGIDTTAAVMLKNAGFLVEEYPDAALFSREKLSNILKDADAVIAGLEPYTKEVIENMPKLKIIARRGVGVDNISQEAIKERSITLTRTEGCVEDAVSELVMAYILEHSRKLSMHNQEMKQGIWAYHIGSGLKGKTLGIAGFGSIGKATAIRANAFGMKVLCYHRHSNPEMEKEYNAEYVDFDTLLKESDYLSISIPLNSETRNTFNQSVFERMKPSAVLINTARGPIVNANDLATALKNKQIAGACIDVFDHEPCTDSPLRELENVILTPHIGTFTKETFVAMNNHCANSIIDFFK